LLDEQPSGTFDLAVSAAAMRLREARGADGTFAAVREILSDLIGCAHFGVFSLESRASVFSLKAGAGEALARPHIPVQPGAVRQAGALAALPLRRDGQLAGALMLFALLPQKDALDAIDQAVLNLVASEAGEDLLDAASHGPLN
jgi:hypothetical protein